MEWGFVLGLGGITLLVICFVIYFGLKLNKAVLKRAPDIAMPLNITLAGTVLWGCVVGSWVACLVAARLRPETSLGAFVGTSDGVVIVLVGSMVVAGVAAAVLEKLGYPIATTD